MRARLFNFCIGTKYYQFQAVDQVRVSLFGIDYDTSANVRSPGKPERMGAVGMAHQPKACSALQ